MFVEINVQVNEAQQGSPTDIIDDERYVTLLRWILGAGCWMRYCAGCLVLDCLLCWMLAVLAVNCCSGGWRDGGGSAVACMSWVEAEAEGGNGG